MGSLSNNPPNEEEGNQYSSSLVKKSILPYPLYAILPIVLIHFYFNPFSFSFPTTSTSNYINQIPPSSNRLFLIPADPPPPDPTPQVSRKDNVSRRISCDYSQGEWVPDKEEPLYDGTTCDTIKKGQNCMVSGRPDRGYLYWKWRPQHCNLPRFDPHIFLKILQNKHMAFVGDSLARNQLESLLCMTAAAAKPTLFYTDGEDNRFRKWRIPSHNITVSIYWSPFLVSGVEKTAEKNFNTLFLDSVNEIWAADLAGIDVLVLSAGHWFLHSAVYYDNDTVIGCHYCQNHTEIGFYNVFGRALRTAFEAIIERRGGDEREMNVFLTTFTPAHFEGEWDKLGACSKTRPFKEDEQILEGMNEEMRRVGVERVGEARVRAEEEANNYKVRFEVLDVSKMALMRPDGHPGPYMNPFPFANGVGERVQNDCVHWCLPGPIDAWNQILLDLVIKNLQAHP
ncbi:hypothetical protein C2S51_030072 [Perilla frutescens var. frutescens]|nr:hypothetical protein C2S51_030072 [Perilla frutescens var. frutescens]